MQKRSEKKNEGEDKPEERNRKRKSEGRKEVGKKRKREFQKGSEKTFFFSKIIAKRNNENIICPNREDTFFQRKGF